jgi:DNA repair photolyase
MNVVYEPKGRAREYSELACNLYMGCTHGCLYCYAPACMRTTDVKWHSRATPRQKVIEYFEKDAVKLRGDKRRILFSFLSDPYQPLEREERLTRQALRIVNKYRLKSQILTKGSVDLIDEDMPLMKKADTHLGITLSFSDDQTRQQWEPNASSVSDRLDVLKKAHKAGIFTWVSLEPVIDPKQALSVIKTAHKYVRFWKVGKLNHMKEYESKINWAEFLSNAETLFKKYNTKYYIKNDLRTFAKRH